MRLLLFVDYHELKDRSKSILLWWFFLFYVLVFKIFLCCWRLMYVCIFLVKVTEWPPIGKIAAHSAYEMFSWYKYLIVSLVFSHLGFWSGSLFLIAPLPDLCLLVFFNHTKNQIAQFLQTFIIFSTNFSQYFSILAVWCRGSTRHRLKRMRSIEYKIKLYST